MRLQNITYTFLVAVISLPCLAFTDSSLSAKIKEGNALLEQGKLSEAMTKYSDAQLEAPLQPEIFFNMGNVLYREKKYAEAADSYQKAMEKGDASLEAKAFYNIGNALFQQGQLRQALDAYKQALERDPGDVDTKYNIEYTERKMKEMLSRSQVTIKQALAEQARREQASQDQSAQNQQGQEQEQDQGTGSQTEEMHEASAAKQQEGSESGEEGEQGEEKDGQSALMKGEEGRDESSNEDSQKESSAGKREDGSKEATAPGDQEGKPGELDKNAAERFLAAFEQDQKEILPPVGQKTRRGYADNVDKDW
ncbi:MAG: tetratricopeptide repeat protein [Candidatus Omnitrophica bacterium]|nr:tetratricopeptide repeat protein [Candidatus Omnitrophota bacterium]